MKVVETENLLKIYHFGDVEVTALNRVNLAIAEHEFVAVWGPSGSGKSTFCNVIGMLDAPTEGDVRIREVSVANLSDAKRSEMRNSYIGFVFQNFNLVPVLSALENVMLPLQIQGVSKKIAKEKATKLLEEVELADRMGHRPQKLSGGQQQRVAIARALVTDPLLVIADEPTANLDTRSANLIVNLMRRINETRGAAFVFSTHDDRLLDRVDRKIHLQDGVVIEDIRSNEFEPAAETPPPARLPESAPIAAPPSETPATAPVMPSQEAVPETAFVQTEQPPPAPATAPSSAAAPPPPAPFTSSPQPSAPPKPVAPKLVAPPVPRSDTELPPPRNSHVALPEDPPTQPLNPKDRLAREPESDQAPQQPQYQGARVPPPSSER